MMDRDALPHSACHSERSLISSVPHAVLDDKMATAAILAVLMPRPDTAGFYLLSVGPEHPPRWRKNNSSPSALDVCGVLSAAAVRNTCSNGHASGLCVLVH